MSCNNNWDTSQYAINAKCVSDIGISLVEYLDPKKNEKILDVGCGDGELTKKILEYGAQVIGVDSNSKQIEKAKAIGINAICLDAQKLTFNCEFDAVFSNASVHWMPNVEDLIKGIYNSLKEKGRFIADFGGKGNLINIENATYLTLKSFGIKTLPKHPWYFPKPEEYKQLLEKNLFKIQFIELYEKPTIIDYNAKDWLNIYC
jgi:SAM-dependent methyltransferase